MRKLLGRFAICIAALLAANAAHGADAPRAGIIEAVWKPQSMEFHYRSEGRLYPCAILEYKVGMILRRLGASESLRLRGDGCHDLDRVVRFEVTMESPVEATAAAIDAVTTYSSEDELRARLRGEQLPSAADLERFPAMWRSVSFRRGGQLDLDAGDCALVQQLRKQVLTRMSVQVTTDIRGVDCSQELSGFAKPRLTVLALVPVQNAR